MKTIVDELKEFFDRTGRKQADLAAASGVPASTICNLLKGKRKHLLGPNQDAVRKAMQELKAGPVGVGGVVGVDEGSRERGTKRPAQPERNAVE